MQVYQQKAFRLELLDMQHGTVLVQRGIGDALVAVYSRREGVQSDFSLNSLLFFFAIPHECVAISYRKKSMDQPGKVANPARGQLNRENEYFSVPVRA